MWTQRILIDDHNQITSPVELLVLATVESENAINPSDLLHSINDKLQHYTPKRGTIYPILERLRRYKLLDVIEVEEGKIEYRRSNFGSHTLINSSQNYLNHLENTLEYLDVLIKAIIKENPGQAIELVSKVSEILENVHNRYKVRKQEVENEIAAEWANVDIDFD